ncbi:MAG: HAD family hydrolase [Cyclobacteriaceae bacterium]
MKKILLVLTLIISIWSCENTTKTEGSAEHSNETADPLPSWNNGETKQAIIDFVTKTTTADNPYFVKVEDRVACFDNDGTLWSEQPIYFQLAFAIDRVNALAADHPEWKTKQPFKSLLEGDLPAALAGGEHALLEIVMATHAGMTTDEFAQIVTEWIATARHPETGKLYKEMVYQPMLELLDYLRANGYKTFIVSGGGVDFMRPWVEEVYGISPDQVVGSSGKVKYEEVEGRGQLVKLPELNFIDDKEGKPIGIHQYIGKRPIFAAGNSDGDYAMLQYASTGPGPSFGMIVHHTDSVREVAYDRNSSIGRLDRGLTDVPKYGWVVVDMATEWVSLYRIDQ